LIRILDWFWPHFWNRSNPFTSLSESKQAVGDGEQEQEQEIVDKNNDATADRQRLPLLSYVVVS